MNDNRWALLGLACLVGMILRAAWATQYFDWPMNLLACIAGVALLLAARKR